MSSFVWKVLISFTAITLCYEAYSLYGSGQAASSHPLTDVLYKPPSIPSLIHPHGGNECLPSPSHSLILESKDIRTACQQASGYPLASSGVRIGTVTAHFGSPPQEHYQKALRTHLLHSLVHDTSLEVMCSPIIDDLWNKPAFILSLLLDEMMKPAEQRLEWIFWVDRDTLILDQCRPLSSFLPADKETAQHHHRSDSDANAIRREDDKISNDGEDIHLLVTNDWNGLNNGVFFVRVNQWAIELFSDIVAFRYYRPNVSLPFTEQSAMEIVMNQPRFQKNTQLVPQEWFNAYPKSTPAEFEEREDEQGLENYHARRGDFLLHFAGRPGKDRLINQWVEMLAKRKGPWQREQLQRNVTASIHQFWSKLGYFSLN